MPTVSTSHDVTAAHARTRARHRLLADLRKTWGKFDDDELRHLRDIDDLVSQLLVRYGMDEAQARRDAEAVVAGRSF